MKYSYKSKEGWDLKRKSREHLLSLLLELQKFGDCKGVILPPGNVHNAECWREVLEPIVERYRKRVVCPLFRADGAFAKPEVNEYLEPRDIGYVIRLPANEMPQEPICRYAEAGNLTTRGSWLSVHQDKWDGE
jgi:hypothetical protein